jgi:hypothetical protein
MGVSGWVDEHLSWLWGGKYTPADISGAYIILVVIEGRA